MANQLYDGGREGFLDGSIDWDNDTIKAVVTDNTYTPLLASHRNLSDIPGGARVAISAALGVKTVAAGVADADDPVFIGVPGGKTINRIVLYKDTGVEATSRLIGQLDTLAGAVPVSIPTSGGDIIFRWDNGSNKIFKL